MPAANSSINLIDLDFHSLKANFKNYMRNQARFKDFDFEGSNINVLIDLLTYNTFKNSFFTNMLFSEAFLDTAQMRGSLISHAKELNYTPHSARSSKATIQVSFEALGTSQPYIIPKGQTVSAIVKNSNFTFSLPETLSVASVNTSFSFVSDIYEGIYVKDTYIYNQIGTTIPRFQINNKNADTSSLTVVVYADNSTVGDIYTQTQTLLDLNFNSKVFFLQCNENENYEVYFGDNVLGKSPSNFSTVVLDYRIASGNTADGAISFVLNFNPTGPNSELIGAVDVETVEVSKGGANVESTESIRYYAPRAFQVQERTVTSSDYQVALKTQFPEINAVYAYGGETVDPPQFGRVFVAVDISDVQGFPDSKKDAYLKFIKNRAPFSIEPIMIEPEYAFLSIKARVRFNVNITKIDTNTMRTIIVNTILNYRDNFLNNFNVTYRNSQLSDAIDSTDTSIVSSALDVMMYKKINILLGINQSVFVPFNTRLDHNIPSKTTVYPSTQDVTFTSSAFRYKGLTCLLQDDGAGNIRIVSTDGVNNTRIADVGSIDYGTGLINIPVVQIDTFFGNSIKLYVKPYDTDIAVTTNTLLTIEEEEAHVTVEPLQL